MLSREDNELLCRVGPGTPMGNLVRQYWVIAALSSELPEPEGSPLRVRLLGEDLIAYRTASGAVGLIQNNCPHRGASLFYGRKAEKNPYDANTLEWTTDSPPPHGNWPELPECYRGPYEYSHPESKVDFWQQNEPV